MSNPWLTVPLEDYEGHMNSAEVRQLGVLSELFAEALTLCRPASVAILGIAGGNGLERIDPNVTKRIIGVDVNPAYLNAVSRRYARRWNLELHCADLASEELKIDAVELVHAALIFEHTGIDQCLDNALSLVAREGKFSVVLQLPSEVEQGVSATQFTSIQNLKSHFSFVDPAWMRRAVENCGFHVLRETRRELTAGKAFWMGVFERTLP